MLADESGWLLQLEGEADLAGLPESVRSAARGAAQQRGLPAGAHVVTLSPSLAEPFLTFSARRDLREKVWHARMQRGANGGEHDNRAIAARIIELRQEQAALHGYANYADYALADRMASGTAAVLDLLTKAWEPAVEKAGEDRVLLTQMASDWASRRRSPPGTGATSPRRCGSRSSTSMTRNSSPTSASTT